MGDQFLWRVNASGVWDTANNWADTTASLSPAPSPPGAADGATIDGPNDHATYLGISGPGSADEFSSTGNVGLSGGTFAFGTLTLGSPGLLNIGVGASVAAASMSGFTGTVQVSGAGASLSVGGAVADGGSIVASNGASISLAGLSFMADGFGSIGVDATSVIEIGPGSGSAPATGAITVDAGVTIDEPGPVDATFNGALVDNGIIMVSSTGTVGFPGIDFNGPVSGSGTLVTVNHSALLFESSVSTNLAFSGGNGLVNFEGGSIGTGVISGFAASDRLYFTNMAFDTASYAATGPGLGQITLAENGINVGTITLAGTYDATTTFLSLPDVFGDTQLELALGSAGAGGTGPSAGTGGNDSFAWQPTAGGDWGVAGNWLDNGSAAVVAPGSNDLVTIAGSTSQFQVVRGQGNALQLAITGDIALGGLFSTGALNIGGNITADVALLAGSSVSASSVSVGGGTLGVSGATLTVSGGLSDDGSLIVMDHAKVTAASLTTTTIWGVVVDATSILDIGGGGGTAGFLTVDEGAVWSGYGTVEAAVIDNGTIAVTQANGEMALKDAVTGSGTILIGGTFAQVTLDNTVAASATIMFAGPADTLAIAGVLPAAGIGGFAVGDAIVFKALDFDSVSTAAAGGGNTTLTMLQDGSAVGTLSLIGSVPVGDSFIVTPVPFLATGEVLQLAAGTLGAGGAAPSAGTATSDVYQWNASSGGDWGDVANWTDTSAGSTTVAPGANDSVVIAGSTSTLQVVSGQGDAASLTISGQLVLGGIFQVGSLNLGSFATVVIGPGATLGATNASLQVRALDVSGAGAAMHSSGVLQFSSIGTLDAIGGGTITAAGMSTTGETVVSVDSASAIEIGAGGGATTGSIVIDSGTTVDGAFLFSGPLIDNGVISTGSLTAQMNAPVTGNGTIVIGNGGGLDVSAPIGADITIEFAGATGTLELSTKPVGIGAGDTVAATGSIEGPPGLANITADIVGYTAGDTIIIGGATIDSADYFATEPGTGELVLSDNGAVVTVLGLSGDYTGDSFIAAPLFGNTEVLMSAPCFAAGTKLLTADGEVAVEQLAIGALVPVMGVGVVPIKWIGFRQVICRNHPAPRDVWPVRVRAGAFGDNVPHRDLLLSPDHAVFLDGTLIPVRYLINDATIVQEAADSVTYWHVELARHEVLLAEGLACESYLDTGNRAAMTDSYWLRNGRVAA